MKITLTLDDVARIVASKFPEIVARGEVELLLTIGGERRTLVYSRTKGVFEEKHADDRPAV